MAKQKQKQGFTQLYEPVNHQPLEVLTRGGKPYKTPKGMLRKVKIQGKHFVVAYHSQIYTVTKIRLRGIVMYNQRLIVIDPTQTLPMMLETLYHEMAHVYLNDWQEKSKPLHKLSPVQVEEICDLFAAAHYDACQNNPGPSPV